MGQTDEGRYLAVFFIHKLTMEPVDVEIDLSSSKAYCPVAKDLLREVRSRARQQGVSTETLINLWLQERLCAS